MLRCVCLMIVLGAGSLTSAAPSVVVLIDDSGSMDDPLRSNRNVRKIDAAKQALRTVLEQLPDAAQVGVLALNSQGSDRNWIIPLGPINRSQLEAGVARLEATGGTPLGQAMKTAADRLLRLREKQYYGDYRLLIVTDGEAQDGDLVDRYLPEIMRRGVTVDVIGVSMAQDHSLATRVDRYRAADDQASLQRAIQESLAETPLDPQDPNEASDFELLQGLTDADAQAVLTALTHVDNRPIGEETDESDEVTANARGGVWPPSSSAVPPGNPAAPPPVDPPDARPPFVVIFGIILLLMVMFKSITRVAKRRRS